MQIKVDISYENVENILVTALEGGSNYWYLLRDSVPGDKGLSLAEKLAVLLYKNPEFEIKIYDLENEDEVLGTLSQASFIHGLKLAFKTRPFNIGNLLSEGGDAEDADVVFQLIVMGEVVFG
jgi:hypothetical protein